MSVGKFLQQFAMIFVIAFITGLLVSGLYNLIAHQGWVFEWGTAVRMGVIFGVVLPLAQRQASK